MFVSQHYLGGGRSRWYCGQGHNHYSKLSATQCEARRAALNNGPLGCCDGNGQTFHTARATPSALDYVSLCANPACVAAREAARPDGF